MKVSDSQFAIAALCLIALAACSGKKLAGDTGAEAASGNDVAAFMGTWKLAGSSPAPWVDTGFVPAPDPAFAEKPIVFTETTAAGPAIVTCDKARYGVTLQPIEGLFEGNLPDIENDARSLGIEPDAKNIPTLMEGCDVVTGDLELSFHLIDKNTLLLGLDNTIYRFSRQP